MKVAGIKVNQYVMHCVIQGEYMNKKLYSVLYDKHVSRMKSLE
jgi:hypothetical protein